MGFHYRSDEASNGGHKNYETWAVATYLGNDQGLYDQALEIARIADQKIYGSGVVTLEDRADAMWEASDALKHMVDEWALIDEANVNLFRDEILRYFMDNVDWRSLVYQILDTLPVEMAQAS